LPWPDPDILVFHVVFVITLPLLQRPAFQPSSACCWKLLTCADSFEAGVLTNLTWFFGHNDLFAANFLDDGEPPWLDRLGFTRVSLPFV